MSDSAVVVDNVSKKFRLYRDRNDSLKIALLRGRRAQYEEFWALRDVSFEIPRGSTFALIGENGSGKSTLLKCLARILTPDQGSIRVQGKVSALLELGAGFHAELSGRENVYLNGSILGLSKRQIDPRFDDIVGFAGLEQFIDVPVKNYSSGMYVRLGFSVAINVDPDVLLVDEVLAVGDAEFQRRCIEKVSDLSERGKTIVIVTHALDSVRNLAHQAALLEHGRLRDVGPAGDVIDGYLSELFAERQSDGEHGQRWGSGEALITTMQIRGDGSRPGALLHTGDPAVLRFHIEASEPVDDVVVGFALYRIDGSEAAGSNTRDAQIRLDLTRGARDVDFCIPRLPLVPGVYDLSGSVYDSSLSHAYDHRHRSLRFDIAPGTPKTGFGVFALEGTWEVAPRG